MLLRCRVTNADTDVFIRLGGGFVSSQIAYNETVRMTGETDWVYIPMGVVSFPPSGDRAQPSFTAGTLPSAWGLPGTICTWTPNGTAARATWKWTP